MTERYMKYMSMICQKNDNHLSREISRRQEGRIIKQHVTLHPQKPLHSGTINTYEVFYVRQQKNILWISLLRYIFD